MVSSSLPQGSSVLNNRFTLNTEPSHCLLSHTEWISNTDHRDGSAVICLWNRFLFFFFLFRLILCWVTARQLVVCTFFFFFFRLKKKIYFLLFSMYLWMSARIRCIYHMSFSTCEGGTYRLLGADLCGCWLLSLGLLQEQKVLLTTQATPPTTIFFSIREIMLACCYRAGSSNLLRVTQKSYECSSTQNHKLIWNITELFLVTWLCGSWGRVLKMTISRHNIMQNKPMYALNVSMRVCIQFYRGLWLPIVLFSKHRLSHRHRQTLHVLMVTWRVKRGHC